MIRKKKKKMTRGDKKPKMVRKTKPTQPASKMMRKKKNKNDITNLLLKTSENFSAIDNIRVNLYYYQRKGNYQAVKHLEKRLYQLQKIRLNGQK